MSSPDTTARALEDLKVNVKLKLAGLWTTLMFVYLYVDYIGLFKPGVIEGTVLVIGEPAESLYSLLELSTR